MGNLRKTLIIAGVLVIPIGTLHAIDSLEGHLYSRAGMAVYLPDEALPTPSGKCETCNGTGRVGDGRVFTKCLDCDGDGVRGVSQGCSCEDCTCENCVCVPAEIETVSYVEEVVCANGRCTPVVRTVSSGGEVSGSVASELQSSGSCGDAGPVRGVIQRVRENKPVRTVLRNIVGRLRR